MAIFMFKNKNDNANRYVEDVYFYSFEAEENNKLTSVEEFLVNDDLQNYNSSSNQVDITLYKQDKTVIVSLPNKIWKIEHVNP